MSIASAKPPPAKDPAEQASQLLVRLAFVLLALGAPCLAIVSRRAIFLLVPIGSVLIALARALAPGRPTLRESLEPFTRPAALAALFLAGWAALSLAWTPWLASGGERWFKTAGTLFLAAVACVLLPPRTRAATLYLLPAGVAIASLGTLAAALFGWTNAAIFPAVPNASTLVRAGTGIALLLWPALAVLAMRQRWIAAGTLAALAALAAIAVWTPIVLVSLAIGAGVFALAAAAPLAPARLLGGLVALLFLGAPAFALVADHFLHASSQSGVLAPIAVWADVIRAGGLRALTGQGIDSASHGVSGGALPPATPHSILFEVWYDYGLVGACAAAALCVLAFRRAAALAQPLAGFLIAALACGLTLAIVGFVSAQLWWATLVSLAGLCFSAARKGLYRTQRPRISPAGPPPDPRRS